MMPSPAPSVQSPTGRATATDGSVPDRLDSLDVGDVVERFDGVEVAGSAAGQQHHITDRIPHPDGLSEPDGQGLICPLQHDDVLLTELTHLRTKLETLPVIEQAKGVLMGYYGISAAVAFSVLHRWSTHTNIKLRVLSGLLVETASQPETVPSNPHPGITDFINRLSITMNDV